MFRYRSRYQSRSSSKNGLHWILHVICFLLIGFLLYQSASVGGINSENFQNQIKAQIRSEMELALSSAGSLSRLGATTTSPTLGKIRQYVHGIELINQFSVSTYGEIGRLFEPILFSNIYDAIDAFDVKLASGQSVNEVLNNLNETLEVLDNQVRLL